MKRAEVLEVAKRCVCGDREEVYGSPERNFEATAALWTTYLRAVGTIGKTCVLGAEDVAAMLALLKISRIASGEARDDNWIDLAGYAAIGAELQEGERAKRAEAKEKGNTSI